MSHTLFLLVLFSFGHLVYGFDAASEYVRIGKLPFPENAKFVQSLTAAERQSLRQEALKYLKENPHTAPGAMNLDLAMFDDEEALRTYADEFIRGIGQGSDLLSATLNPRAIELLSSEFASQEPYRLMGYDFLTVPTSFRVVELTTETLSESPAFDKSVQQWAKELERLEPTRRRATLLAWWKKNEPFFRARDYKAVRPVALVDPIPAATAVPASPITGEKPVPGLENRSSGERTSKSKIFIIPLAFITLAFTVLVYLRRRMRI